MNKIFKSIQANMLYILFGLALASTLISLSLSEIFHLAPCVLCWYQRTMMYPLPIIFGIGIYRKDRDVDLYAWPLAIIGWLVALYHTLLQWSIIPDSIAPCQAGISCTTKQINYFGFMTIPFMSLMAFSGILIGLYIYKRGKHE